MGVVVRRYIDILIIIITFPYSTRISSFFGSVQYCANLFLDFSISEDVILTPSKSCAIPVTTMDFATMSGCCSIFSQGDATQSMMDCVNRLNDNWLGSLAKKTPDITIRVIFITAFKWVITHFFSFLQLHLLRSTTDFSIKTRHSEWVYPLNSLFSDTSSGLATHVLQPGITTNIVLPLYLKLNDILRTMNDVSYRPPTLGWRLYLKLYDIWRTMTH